MGHQYVVVPQIGDAVAVLDQKKPALISHVTFYLSKLNRWAVTMRETDSGKTRGIHVEYEAPRIWREVETP